MKLHANGRLSVKGRELLIDRKWRARHHAEGPAGLLDRSSAPRSVPTRTSEDRIQAIAALRRLRFT
ncbi:MAG TPA: leucine zipper domain-containing protein, partial [Acidimicrobiia bacterium]|nr:leucine zipper domain-containing protein [Acidimicrobiia bacterium]